MEQLIKLPRQDVKLFMAKKSHLTGPYVVIMPVSQKNAMLERFLSFSFYATESYQSGHPLRFHMNIISRPPSSVWCGPVRTRSGTRHAGREHDSPPHFQQTPRPPRSFCHTVHKRCCRDCKLKKKRNNINDLTLLFMSKAFGNTSPDIHTSNIFITDSTNKK